MTNQQHPITPPQELVHQWATNWNSENCCDLRAYIANCAAQWAADQELKACCEWAKQFNYDDEYYDDKLRATRRPKPLSKTDLALASLEEIIKLTERLVPRAFVDHSRYDTMRSNNMQNLSAHVENVRLALEKLND